MSVDLNKLRTSIRSYKSRYNLTEQVDFKIKVNDIETATNVLHDIKEYIKNNNLKPRKLNSDAKNRNKQAFMKFKTEKQQRLQELTNKAVKKHYRVNIEDSRLKGKINMRRCRKKKKANKIKQMTIDTLNKYLINRININNTINNILNNKTI